MTGNDRSVTRRGLMATFVVIAGFVGQIALMNAAWAQGRRHAALIVDANSGRVISESAADEPRFPASLTKMMTLYLVFESIEQNKLTYQTPIVFSESATRVPPTKLGIQAGGSITVLDAIKALIVKSANDASVALAEHIAGSEAKFAALMTQTARRIGMKSTTFKNAHGLPDSEQVTTARDMITLGLRLQDDFPRHYPLFSTREFSHRGETIRTHNALLLTYEGTDGIKTGYIGASGFNLVANVKRGDKHVIGVVFGGATAGARNNTMKTLLNVALFKASSTKTRVIAPMARGRNTPVPHPAVVARTAPDGATAPPVRSAPVVVAAAAVDANATVQIARVRPLVVAPRPPQHAALPATLAAPAVGVNATAVVPNSKAGPQHVAMVPPPGGSRLNGPAPAAMTGRGIHIQVGAFNSKPEADRRLADVQQQAGVLLANFATASLQAVSNGKTVFRARFVGVDPAAAGNVCNELRRRNIDCLVAKPE